MQTLAHISVCRLLEHFKDYDEQSADLIRQVLDEFGAKTLVRGAHTPRAFAGLRHLGPDWQHVDACRVYLAGLAPRKAAAFFESVAACDRRDDAVVWRDVAAVCRAFVGNDRFKRDMTGPLLPKAAADTCRTLRNLADSRADERPDSTILDNQRPRRLHWRFQDLRQAATDPRYRTTQVVRGPWFPGYEH